MSNIENVELGERVLESYMSYAMATIVDRALPDVRDGCLPIHRRILFAMKKAGMTYDKDFSKSGSPVAKTMEIHQHGDSSIYGSLALMTDRNETLLHPLIQGQGSFGKVYLTDNPSHMRYTFCKLNKFSEEMFQNINKGVVQMLTMDDHEQPVVLPVTYPSILVKPNSAIAVGESCDFGSFPLDKVCDFTKAYIKNNNINPIDYLIPDFSTGGYLLYDKNKLQNILDTGRGSIRLRGKYYYDKDENAIIFTQLPYKVTTTKVINEYISKIDKFNKDIYDIVDSTEYDNINDRETLGLTVQLKKKADVDVVVKKLFKETSLESNFSFNMNCLVNNEPKVYGVVKIIEEWLNFRRECVKKSLLYDINKKEEQVHILNGLSKILLDIDKAIDIIRHCKKKDINTNLKSYFNIDDIQADNIIKIQLYNINEEYIIEKISNIKEINNELENLKSKLNYIDDIIIKDLDRVSKEYGQPRKTEIIYKDTLEEISSDELIEDYNCRLILSSQGYLKKHLRQSDSHKLKDDDYIIQETSSTNKSTILLFSDKGNRYKLNCYDLKTYEPKYYGDYTPNLIDLDKDERIISIASLESQDGYMLSIYENGHIAKVDIKSFMSANKKLLNCYSDKSKLLDIKYIKNDVDVMLLSSEGKLLIVNSSNINPVTSKNSQGVVGMKLDGNIVINCIIECNKNDKFTVTTKKGKTKEFSLDDIAPTNKPNEDRNIYDYCSGKRGNQGNFIWNLRNSSDEIIKIDIGD